MPGAALRLASWVAFVLLFPAVCRAAQNDSSSMGTSRQIPEQSNAAPAVDSEVDPFEKNALGVEFGLGALYEAWNLNRDREWLADGSASIWWAVRNGLMLLVQFDAIRVFQSPGRNAFVNGVSPLLRWRALDREGWDLFVEAGPGISWSDTVTPPSGTRANYLALAAVGFARRLGRQSHAIAGFRWIHLSNNGREGRGRNPDIEALGGFAGVTVAFD